MSGPSSITVYSKYACISSETPSIKFKSTEEETHFHTQWKKETKLKIDSAVKTLEALEKSIARKHNIHLLRYRKVSPR